MNNNVPMSRPGWIFSPRTFNYLMTLTNTNGFFLFRQEMMGGNLWNWPYRVTTQVPINLTDHGGTTESEIYLADFDDAVIGEAQSLMIDVSQEAAYHDGSNVVAAFSQDQTVIRSIAEHDFAMRRAVSIAVLNGVTWA
jgi:HK97 family phage major capsid protein